MLRGLLKEMGTRDAVFPRHSPADRFQPARCRRLAVEQLESRLMLDAGPLLISEFLAINDTVLADEGGTGDFSDWVEIYNPTDSVVNLEGWYLTDNDDNLTKWRFPAVSVQPDAYLLVFASGKDRLDPDELHASFKLSGGGEYLALVLPDGITVSHSYTPEFPEQQPDVSYGITKDLRTLVPRGADGVYRVPTIDDALLGTSWTDPEFDDSNWQKADSVTGIGFSPDELGIGDLVDTDIAADMLDVGSSIWLRIPFEASDLAVLNELDLWMKYEDGIVVYLNGEEVARRNAHDPLQWNSTASWNRQIQDALLFENIDVSSQLGLLREGTNVLAIHGLNDRVDDEEFLVLPRLDVSSDEFVMRYLAIPTPGKSNELTLLNVGPTFSQRGGTFIEPLSLKLATDAPTGVIRYTLDGTKPTETSSVYMSPIVVDRSMQVRARVYREGMEPGPIVTESYLELATDLHDFTSPLPLVVIETFGHPIPEKSSEAHTHFGAAHMAIFETTDHDMDPWTEQRSTMVNVPDLAARIGIKTRGSSSAVWPKHSYRLEGWNEVSGFTQTYEEMKLNDKDIAPLGMPADSDWILGSYYQFDRALMRNALMYELSNQVGRYAARTRYVEVFVNADGGPVSYADYLGVYSFMENVKRDEERVDIEKLNPTDATEPNISGGYMFKHDRDAPTVCGGRDGFSAGGLSLVYDELDACDLTSEQKTWLTGYLDTAWTALRGPDFTDPELGYARYIDVDSWIDHHWLNVLTKNPDAFMFSAYWFKDRNRPLELGPIWDFDRSMGPDEDGRAAIPSGWGPISPVGTYWVSGWWDRLFDDPDFGQRWIDRWPVLKERGLNIENIHSVINSIASDITEEAANRNFSKWPEDRPDSGDWVHEVDELKDWLANRVAWIDKQFLAPVALNEDGGLIEAGFEVTMSAPIGSIYYTLDGSDPRGRSGEISDDALLYDGPIVLSDSTRIKARAWNGVPLSVTLSGPVGGWSPPMEADFFVDDAAGAENLVITELNYNPYAPTPDERAAGFFDNDAFEFIELFNIGSKRVHLGDVQFADGVHFHLTGSGVRGLDSGERLVVAKNPAAFQFRYGTEVKMVGGYENDMSLNNGGERLLLLDRLGNPIVDFVYDDDSGWPSLADGKGASLELIDATALPLDSGMRQSYLESGQNWRSSSEYGGSPGRAGVGPLDNVVINEVLSHTDPPLRDSIELHNITESEIDVGGWFLSDSWGWAASEGGNGYKKFHIPDGTTIPGGGYLVFDERDFNPTPWAPQPWHFGFDRAHGDDAWLMKADTNGNLTHFIDNVEFPAAINGESFGRWPNGVGELYPMAVLTLDPDHGENSGPRAGQVILSEVHYNPGEFAGASDLEFIEVYNSDTATVDLSGWRLRGAVEYEFPGNTQLAAGHALVITPFSASETSKLTAFLRRFQIDESVQIVGMFSGPLDDQGGSIRLERPTDPPPDEPHYTPYLWEDEATFDDEESWPPLADGNGSSLNRRSTNAWGNSSFAWRDFEPTPGRVDFADDPYEPNDSMEEAYHLAVDWPDTPLSAVAGPGVQGDEDWYRVDVTEGRQRLVTEVIFRHADGNIDLAVTGDAVAPFAVAHSTTDDERIDVVLPSDGIWYLRVYGDNAGNTYDLRWDTQPAHLGDANLDGVTDLSDFNIWNANKFTYGTTWRRGDFNGDGQTDLSDFNIWNAHKFTSVWPPPPANDIILGQAAARKLAGRKTEAELAWLCALDQLLGSHNQLRQDKSVAKADVVDRVLATYWPGV